MDEELFQLYQYKRFGWENISFHRRMLKVNNELRYPIRQATTDWNALISKMQSVDGEGIKSYLNKRGKLFAIINLDVILGIGFKIFDPTKYNYGDVKFDPVSKDDVSRLSGQSFTNANRRNCIEYLKVKHRNRFSILKVQEKVAYSNMSSARTRISFLFTVQKSKADGFIVMESLDENTATHLFSTSWNDLSEYYKTLAKIRHYLTSRIINKRERLYSDNFNRKFGFERAYTLTHRTVEQWRRDLAKVLS